MSENRKNGNLEAQNDSDDISNEALIDLAYSMAVEPQRFHVLSKILDDRLHALHRAPRLANEQDEPHPDNLEDISSHFERAFDLLDRQGRRFNYATGSIRYVDSDARPSALVRADGRVFHANQAAVDILEFTKGDTVNPTRFDDGHHKRLMRDVQNIANHETDKMIAVYNLHVKGEAKPIKMALSKALDYNGDPIARLCTFHIKWLSEMSRQFKDGFNLTDAEVVITKAIVSGVSLKILAEQRERSIATVRTQANALLTKLGLHSQIELACLYSGFTRFNITDLSLTKKPEANSEPWRSKFILDLPSRANEPSGRKLQYEMIGPPKGRPVLYFHSLVGGTVLNKAMRDELQARNIRMIMPWRPHFAGSSPDGKSRGAPERFAQDIEFLLDHLSIETCQITGGISGPIYAYACASHMPERISSIVACGGAIPLLTRKQFKLMDPSSRVSLYIARHTPTLMPMLLRAMLSKIDAGYDEEFIQEHYQSSPVDQDILQNPELKSLIRNMFTIVTAQGYTGFVRDIQTQASKWGHLLEGVTCPVTLLHGENDPVFSIETVRDFVKAKENFTISALAEGGQLIALQHPHVMFEALDALFRGDNYITRTG